MINSKISIITVCLNAELYLEQAISSVINQTFPNKEYIIVDGGSTDNTLNITRKYEARIDKWISEPDKGIADAMNKGLSLATGDYILFLHSDDYLIDSSVLQRASSYLEDNMDIYFFKVLLDDQGIHRESRNKALCWLTNFKMGSCHQGQLCSTRLFKELGPLDTSYKIVMDYDFILRALRGGASGRSIDMLLSVMRLTGISSHNDWGNLSYRFKEERLAHFKNCPTRWMRFLYSLYWVLYFPYRKIRYMLDTKKNSLSNGFRNENS